MKLDKSGPYSAKRCAYCYNLIWYGQEHYGNYCDKYCYYEGRIFDKKVKKKEDNELKLKNS